MPHNHRRFAGGPPVGVGHDGGHLLMAHQDRLDPVFPAMQQLEYLAGASAGDTEDVLDSGLFQGLDDHLAG